MNEFHLKKLESADQLEDLINHTRSKLVVVFKHSTRCSSSHIVLDRLMRRWADTNHEKADVYIVDVIANRKMSDAVSEQWGIVHESPQVLVIDQGKVILHRSHYGIEFEDIQNALQESLS